ncbi:MAG: thioredoxin [Candidatus Magnetominusculus sp. LBB02]|nr:thioredoxin [Candidatus Magnetominusculus sp. LBB02]
MVNLTDSAIETFLLQAPLPVLVDCWSYRHEPCRINAPLVDALCRQFKEKVIIGKLNVDDNPYSAGRYNITAIPALLLFKNGKLLKKFLGNTAKDTLLKAIEALP